jgi:pilus assembly protein CpaF
MAAGMPQPAVHSQLASALDAVVHLTRDESGRRRVGEIAVLVRGPTGLVSAAPAVTFAGDGSTHEHQAAEILGGKLRR